MMIATAGNLLNLSILEARKLFSDTAYNQFVKAVRRPRLAHDNHVLAVPLKDPRVVTCRVIGTDRYIPSSKVFTSRYRHNYSPSEVRKKPISWYAEADTQRLVDLHYDNMCAEKMNIVTIQDLVELLSPGSDKVSTVDIIRLFFLRFSEYRWKDYFTTQHLITESGALGKFLNNLLSLVQILSDEEFNSKQVAIETAHNFDKVRATLRLHMLYSLDMVWRPPTAIQLTATHIEEIQKMVRRNKLPATILLDSLKELCLFINPFAPDTAQKCWQALTKHCSQNTGGDLLNEQPWPMDLSALNSTLDVTFSRQLGADILTRCFHLKSTDIDCITAESVKAYISESAFFTKRFARAKIEDVQLTPTGYGCGFKVAVTLSDSGLPVT